ncbi:hypothetical protein AB0F92_06595 [Kitasatospora aureofaciens]|uniref:hypothetical protein n=1 Tax=Kitasatospora aureofaciens TaxID=1894 RepID=UPI0033C86644
MATTICTYAAHLVDAVRQGAISMDTAYKAAKDTKTAYKQLRASLSRQHTGTSLTTLATWTDQAHKSS